MRLDFSDNVLEAMAVIRVPPGLAGIAQLEKVLGGLVAGVRDWRGHDLCAEFESKDHYIARSTTTELIASHN